MDDLVKDLSKESDSDHPESEDNDVLTSVIQELNDDMTGPPVSERIDKTVSKIFEKPLAYNSLKKK